MFQIPWIKNANINGSYYNYILWLDNCSMYNYISSIGFVLQSKHKTVYYSKLPSSKKIYFKKLYSVFGIIKETSYLLPLT